MSSLRPVVATAALLAFLTGCPKPPPPTLPEDSLGDTTVSVPYSHKITASGGTGALSYSANGLPAGLNMDASGNISGTASASGDFQVSVTVSDAANATATKAYPLKVYAAPAVRVGTLPRAVAGFAYTASVGVDGGKAPVTLSVSTGTLPPGLNLDGANGTLSGTPASAGSFPFTVQAKDANNAVSTRAFSVEIAAALNFVTAQLAPGNVDAPYSEALVVEGGLSPILFSLSSGALPPGLSLGASGLVSGTPTAAGNYAFRVTATDAGAHALSRDVTLRIIATPPPRVVTATLPIGVANAPYNISLGAADGLPPYAWTVVSGTLPAGLTLSQGGVLSGTPTASGTFPFLVSVSDGNRQTATRGLSLEIAAQLRVGTATLPDAYVGNAYSSTLSPTGGKGPFVWSITGTLPSGLGFNSAGILSGTPTVSGTFNSLTFQVADASGQTVSQALGLTVREPPAIATGSFADGYTGSAYSGTLTATGGRSPYAFSVTGGTLPAGMTLSSAGALSGTPTATGTSTFTVSVADANGVAVGRSLSLAIYAPPGVTTSSLPDGYAGSAYAQTLAGSGGKAPLTFSVTAGALPAGLTLSAEGAIGSTLGAVQNNQTHAFTVSVADANGRMGSRPLTLVTYLPPAINNGALTTATEGITYRKAPGTPEAVDAPNGKAPFVFGATGLPSGLALNTATGVISGIPAQGSAGNHAVTLQVTDANARNASRQVTLPVQAARPTSFGGASGVEPQGSPVTDVLTVFVVDSLNRPAPNMGVRVRKNGVEYNPVKQALTDSAGKAFFTGMGCNGTTDTVDVTTNGAGFSNFTIARVNAALVTLNPREIPLPIPRRSAAATYDPVVSRVVLTTGYSARVGAVATRGPTNVEAYDMASHTWSELTPSGLASDPVGRYYTAMAHAAGVNVLFGGFEALTGNILGDTWELNASTRAWTRYDAAGPASRYRPVMTPDGSDGVLMFGGITDSSFSDELWRYRPATHTWTQLTPTNAGPTPRDFYTAAFLPATNELWVCGGSSFRNDCWAYSVTSNTWSTKPALPVTGIVRHSMAQLGGRIYVFGGTVSGSLSNTLYVFDNGAWSTVTLPAGNTPPPARQSATLVSDGSRLLLFGGYVTNTLTPLGDYWTYEAATGWTQRNAPEAPAPVVTVTGNISARNSGAASADVNLTTSSGFVVTATVGLTPPASGTGPATGTWSIPNVPAGEAFEIVAVSYDGNFTYPDDTSYLWSYVESGVLPAGTTTYDIVLPLAQMPVTTVTANLTLPPGWRGADYFAFSRRERQGFGAIGNGTNSIDNVAGTVRWDFFSPTSPVTQNNSIQALGGSPAHCDDAYLYLNGSTGGSVNLAFPAGPEVIGPGRSLCYPTGTGLRRDGFLATFHTQARGTAAGDLNNDGVPDMVAVGDPANVIVHFNSDIYWDISRKNAELTTGVTSPVAVAVADLDRDGKGEVLVVNASGGTGGVGTLQMFEWSAGTTFTALPSVELGPSASGIAVGDVNGDGRADVVVTNAGNNSVTALLGNGSGGFSSTVTSSLSGVTGPQRVLLGEVTGDGRVDAVVLNAGSGNVSVLAGDNTGAFSSAATLATGGAPVSIALGTLNGDSRLDLVVASQGPDSFSVFYNDGTASGFGASTSYPLSNLPFAIGIAELTRDNLKDVVVAQGDQVKIYRGTGSSFTQSFATFGIYQPRDLVLADLVPDGYADVLVVGDSELAMYSGLSPAIPAPEGSYAFIAPNGTRLFWALRRSGGVMEWEYYSRGQPGPNAFSYPLPSTLAPSRPALRGQLVDWTVHMNVYPASSTFSPNAWGVRNLKRDATAYVDNGLEYQRD